MRHLRHSLLEFEGHKLLQVLGKVGHSQGIILRGLDLCGPRGRGLGRLNGLDLIEEEFLFSLGGREGED